MGMGGISIESSFNNKNFEVLHVYLLHRVHEKWWKNTKREAVRVRRANLIKIKLQGNIDSK